MFWGACCGEASAVAACNPEYFSFQSVAPVEFEAFVSVVAFSWLFPVIGTFGHLNVDLFFQMSQNGNLNLFEAQCQERKPVDGFLTHPSEAFVVFRSEDQEQKLDTSCMLDTSWPGGAFLCWLLATRSRRDREPCNQFPPCSPLFLAFNRAQEREEKTTHRNLTPESAKRHQKTPNTQDRAEQNLLLQATSVRTRPRRS